MEAKKEIERLSRELLRHQYLYYVKAEPEISDLEYDKLFDKLVQLEKKYPQLASENSPTKRVGSDLDNSFPEREHTIPVLSLDKEYSILGLEKWVAKTIKNTQKDLSFVVEEKIDGASMVLYYKRGRLDAALTRGNGLVGNDITENARTIKQIPLVVDLAFDFAVRGEIFINRPDFDRYNKEFEYKYSNPRNLAAGSLRNIKSSFVARIPLNAFFYEGYFSEPSLNDHILILARLRDKGFKINRNLGYFSDDPEKRSYVKQRLIDIKVGDIKELTSYVSSRIQQREKLDYEIDGLVIKVNETHVREVLGSTAHHPRWALAFKFDSPTAVTRLKEIQIQVGRNGRVTPVGILEPVPIAGSIVSRATLHNQEYIEMLELGIGDQVSISKRGDIIPAVEEVLEKSSTNPSVYKFTEVCPFCQSLLEKEGAHHFCKNRECPERIKRSIIYFASKDQMDIDSLGEKTIILLFEKGYVKSIPDLYRFDYDELLKEEGFKEKKISKIRKSLEKSKEQPFEKVLVALGFDGLGRSAVSDLIKNGFESVDKIISIAGRKTIEDFSTIEGFGEITANLVIQHFTDPAYLALIKELKKIGLNFQKETLEDESQFLPFGGQLWVITGSFNNFTPRSKAAEEIERRGGKVTNTVSSKTTHLLAGSSPGSKLKKAKNLGISIIDESTFLAMLKDDV
jgi:DNA ligase (NAD+)